MVSSVDVFLSDSPVVGGGVSAGVWGLMLHVSCEPDSVGALRKETVSALHLSVTVGIGLLIGLSGYALRFDRLRGDLLLFPLVCVVGSFGMNLLFRFLVSKKIASHLFYMRQAIILEEVLGSLLAVYLLTLWRAKEKSR